MFKAELFEFGFDHDVAVRIALVVEVVILVIVFSRPEGACLLDAGGQRAADFFGMRVCGGLSQRFLSFVSVEDNTAVLRSDVVALTVNLGGVVQLPEIFQ